MLETLSWRMKHTSQNDSSHIISPHRLIKFRLQDRKHCMSRNKNPKGKQNHNAKERTTKGKKKIEKEGLSNLLEIARAFTGGLDMVITATPSFPTSVVTVGLAMINKLPISCCVFNLLSIFQ